MIKKVVKVEFFIDNYQNKARCTMSDGSLWGCDVSGMNWEKLRPDVEFYTEMFNMLGKPKDDGNN